ncbi:MAG TPA: hypothetical protein VGP63_08720 [Planctomycetaceae bacterium]|jgi:hypothetical protein|nr:hypothetical protein [Planctomycetaceae bacterium]
MFNNIRMLRITAPASTTALLFVVASSLVRPMPVTAQSAATSEERLKAVERERDELKQRNGVLELRLKQLQAIVNKEVTDALRPLREEPSAAPPTPHPPSETATGAGPATPATNSAGTPYWRQTWPTSPRFAGLPPALQSPVDVIGLAVAYQDALGALQKTHRGKDAKDSASAADVDPAERKVRLLRSITMTLRDQAAAEVDRVRKLAAVHAVPVIDLRNLDAKMKILDLILAQDPDAGPMPTESASAKPAVPAKAN